MRMEHHPHGDRLSCIRESSAGTLQPCQDLEGADRKAGEGTFDRGMQRQDGGNGFKLGEGKLRVDIKYKCFTARAGRSRVRLSPSLEVLKVGGMGL